MYQFTVNIQITADGTMEYVIQNDPAECDATEQSLDYIDRGGLTEINEAVMTAKSFLHAIAYLSGRFQVTSVTLKKAYFQA